jgi:hypothetical protein
MAYRISRNLEASLTDRISADLTTDGWTGISVEKSTSEIYNGKFSTHSRNKTRIIGSW